MRGVRGADGALERLLGEEGIESSLQRDPDLATTVKLRVLGRQQQLLRIDFENWPAHEVLRAKLAEFEAIMPRHDVVVLSDYGKGGLAHIARMIQTARALGKTVLVDPKGDDYARYAGATLLTPNRAELREVVGRWSNEADLAARAQRLRERLGVDALLVTRAEEGMTLFRAQGVVHEPTRAREVYDVSGAGDTVIATLAAMMAAGADIVSAMRFANRAAGVVVGKLGTAVAHLSDLETED